MLKKVKLDHPQMSRLKGSEEKAENEIVVSNHKFLDRISSVTTASNDSIIKVKHYCKSSVKPRHHWFQQQQSARHPSIALALPLQSDWMKQQQRQTETTLGKAIAMSNYSIRIKQQQCQNKRKAA